MMFGGPTDAATSDRLIARAAEAGINFLDTADGYNGGRSEEVVGQAIAANRHAWVLATKIANRVGKGPNEGGLSRKWVIQGDEACLQRLGTDFIDILYLHKEDHATPLETTVRALASWCGPARSAISASPTTAPGASPRSAGSATRLGIDRPVVSQPYYNAMNRQPEVEQIPAAVHYGLGVVPYSPLARGVLTAEVPPGETPEAGSRAARQDKRMLETELRPELLQIAAAHPRPCRGARDLAGAFRDRLGAEQPAGHRHHPRATHRGASGRLSGGALLPLHRRG